ncbi:SDR family NAD(P)-dependent oxidoreductase [Ilumatobacter coccineus]|uniref:Putative oxidoreductase n=1 Tax=Ilumatobacter coccineus (strain NBRC 103263 / KCTC 29153 / YM16-304) TaxID=1313172 RepID=A0A6C7EBW9_ILUCY|nr:SDR family oxidoreductase [Ilumatobacter coccineus]BAN02689.1 putative oxidoreductase [Ilumatobacter coccineus YM16-304]
MGSLEGLTAIVIGGHSGFGEAISRTYAAQGAKVVIGGRRLPEVTAMADEVGGIGMRCDITSDDDVAGIVAHAVEATGRLDIFVNCAGFQESTPISDLTPEKLHAMHDVQLAGAMYCLRHAGNAMRDLGNGGSFISISSLTAQNPARGLAAYASAKAGLEYASKIAAVEYGEYGVRFNCIAASLIETPMTAQHFTSGPAIQALTEATPLGYMGASQDIANAALFFASDLGSFVTGQTLCVDGGASLTMLPSPQMYADVGRRWMEAQEQNSSS